VAEINEGDLISKGALNEPKELAKGLELANTKLLELIATMKGLESSIKGAESIKKVNQETNKLSLEEKELQRVTKQGEVLRARNNQAYIQEAANVAKARQELNKATQERAKSLSLYEKERQNLNKLASEYRNVALAQGANSKAAKDLLAQHTKLAGNLNGLNRNLGQFNDNVGNYPKRISAGIASFAAWSVGIMATVATLGRLIKTTKDFEDQNAILRGIMGKTTEQTKELVRQQLALGASTEFSASGVAKAHIELARLGKSTDEILKLTPGVLNAALVFGTDLAPAAELVASNLNAFGLQADQGARVTDILAKSTTISALNFERLKVALPKVGGAAKQLNLSMEETVATLSVVVDKGIEAEKAGTSFRNIMLESAKSGVPWQKQLERINGATDKLAEATRLFGVQDAIVAVAIAESTEKINMQTKALENSAGAAEKFAGEKRGTISGFYDRFTSAVEGMILGLDKGDGAISSNIKSILRLGESIANVLTPMQEMGATLNDSRLAFQAEMSALQNSNLSQEAREKLIEKINIQYKDYLPNILTEKTSLEELAKVQLLVNQQMYDTIILQQANEQLAKQKKIVEDLKNELIVLELKAADVTEKMRLGQITGSMYMAQIQGINANIVSVNASLEVEEAKLGDVTESTENLIKATNQAGEALEKLRVENLDYKPWWVENTDLLKHFKELYEQVFGETVSDTDAIFEESNKKFIKGISDRINAIKTEQETEKELKLTREEGFEYAFQIAQELNDIAGNFAQRRIMDLEAEDQANQKKLENDLFLAGDNAEKKQALEDTYAAKKEAIDQRARQEQRKAAIFQKSIDLAVATSKLALSIISAGAITPQAILTAIVGGLQIAKIASTPIPAYAEGTDNHKGGLAIVGDGGGAELISEPNKAPYLSDSKAELVNLPKGTKVTPHGETMKMLALGGWMRGFNDSRQSEKQTDAIKEGFRSLEKTIKNKKEHNIVGSITGYTRGKTRVKYIDSLRNR
jgi:hypothetical protein